MKIREGDRVRKRFFELLRALIMTVIQGYFTGNAAFTQKIEGVTTGTTEYNLLAGEIG